MDRPGNQFSDFFTISNKSTYKYANTAIENAFREYSAYCINAIGDKSIAISLSFGSDSRTALAIVRKYFKFLTAYTFGDNDMTELRKVKEFCGKYNISHNRVSFCEGYENYSDNYLRASVVSSFLINPFRVHYYTFYKSMGSVSAVFEGTLGSEFVKAELATNAMISPIHVSLLNGIDYCVAVCNQFGTNDLSDELIEYGRKYHEQYLTAGNQKQSYSLWALRNLPSKVFAPLYSVLYSDGRVPFVPFLWYPILMSVFSGGYGIMSYNSVCKGHPGIILDTIPEALGVKACDMELLRSRLSRHFSFGEVLSYNRQLLSLLMRARRAYSNFRERKNHQGQVKVDEIHRAFSGYMKNRVVTFDRVDDAYVHRVNGIVASITDVVESDNIAKYINDLL